MCVRHNAPTTALYPFSKEQKNTSFTSQMCPMVSYRHKHVCTRIYMFMYYECIHAHAIHLLLDYLQCLIIFPWNQLYTLAHFRSNKYKHLPLKWLILMRSNRTD